MVKVTPQEADYDKVSVTDSDSNIAEEDAKGILHFLFGSASYPEQLYYPDLSHKALGPQVGMAKYVIRKNT